MIDPHEFTVALARDFQFISGVPCTYFKGFLAYLKKSREGDSLTHVIATREDEAVGIASGVAFAGKKTVVYLQNSGLGNIGDALTSLAQLYRLPMLLLVSNRGLEDDNDFPEHSVMGWATEPSLEAIKLPYRELTEESWKSDLAAAVKEIGETSSPVVLLVDRGVLSR